LLLQVVVVVDLTGAVAVEQVDCAQLLLQRAVVVH
jgi:hypothetical protein